MIFCVPSALTFLFSCVALPVPSAFRPCTRQRFCLAQFPILGMKLVGARSLGAAIVDGLSDGLLM